VEEAVERRVRGRNGTIPCRELLNLVAIRQWREEQSEAGKPNSLGDYFLAYGICTDCSGYGAKMIGWSDPSTPIDVQAAKELGLEQLPLYEVCPSCQGTGKLT
jgi:hypothetical protein